MAAAGIAKITFALTWKKMISSRMNIFLFSGFLLFMGYLWLKDSFELSLRFFLFLFPYIFLFSTQDMVKDEMENGSLENVLFLGGRFRSYLIWKNLFSAAIAASFSTVIFAFYGVYGLLKGNVSVLTVQAFLAGLLVGIYYTSLGTFLSHYLKGGSNVLVVVLAQVVVFVGLLISAAGSSSFVDILDQGVFPDLVSRVKFLATTAIVPNFALFRRFYGFLPAVAVFSLLFLGLQLMKIRRLELSEK